MLRRRRGLPRDNCCFSSPGQQEPKQATHLQHLLLHTSTERSNRSNVPFEMMPISTLHRKSRIMRRAHLRSRQRHPCLLQRLPSTWPRLTVMTCIVSNPIMVVSCIHMCLFGPSGSEDSNCSFAPQDHFVLPFRIRGERSSQLLQHKGQSRIAPLLTHSSPTVSSSRM